MLKKALLNACILLSSLNCCLVHAASVDYDLTQNSTTFDSIGDDIKNSESSISTLPTASFPSSQSAFSAYELWIKRNLGESNHRYYLKLKSKDAKSKTAKRLSLNLDHSFSTHSAISTPSKTQQPSPQVSKAFKSKPLSTTKIIFSNSNSGPAPESFSLVKPESFSLVKVDKEDIAYIEEELLYSKESGVSYDVEDTSGAVRAFTFYSLDLDDKSLYGALAALILLLVGVLAYAKLRR